MTFELDTLIAIAFLAPVAFFTVLNVVLFRTHGYGKPVQPAVSTLAGTAGPMVVTAEAANDSDIRQAA